MGESGSGSRFEPLSHLFGFCRTPDLAVAAVFGALFFDMAELIYELAELFLAHEVGGKVLGHIAPLVTMALAGVEFPYGVKLGASLAKAPGHQGEFARLNADMAVADIYIGIFVICGMIVIYTLNPGICAYRPLAANAVVFGDSGRGREPNQIDSFHFFFAPFSNLE